MAKKIGKGIGVAREVFAGRKNNAASDEKIILVPVDLNAYSMLAVRQSFIVAAEIGAKVMLLHSYVLPSAADTFSLSPDTLSFEPKDMDLDITIEATAKDQMKSFVADVEKEIAAGHLPKVDFETVVEEGLPETVINEYSREHNPVLIVMVTRDAQKKERELIGSVTAEVLDTTRYPLLTIPENADPADSLVKHTDVACFCNLDNEDVEAINSLATLFPGVKFNVTFYYIESRKDKFNLVNSNEMLPKLTNYCRAKYRDYTFAGRELQPQQARELFVNHKTNNINFILVPNKRRLALTRLFNPGLAHRLLFVADIAMLVVPV